MDSEKFFFTVGNICSQADSTNHYGSIDTGSEKILQDVVDVFRESRYKQN